MRKLSSDLFDEIKALKISPDEMTAMINKEGKLLRADYDKLREETEKRLQEQWEQMRQQIMTDMSSIKQYQAGTNELLVKMRAHID